eukprot:scaffold2911_cov414-Prasinococcus_capsulatus_cf.AAC.52
MLNYYVSSRPSPCRCDDLKHRRGPHMLLAGVEGGGTTFVVAIVEDSPENAPLERAEFQTTTPADTLRQVKKWLREHDYDALGIACFGPVDLRPDSETYGYITTTPKPGWANTDILGELSRVKPNVPVLFDTDVNAPALAEYAYRHGHAHNAAVGRSRRDTSLETSCAYITVGTGVGVGLVINGACVHGM